MNAQRPSPRGGGFTLIELMIAVTLGIVIVYTATTAFRVAAQSVTTANRLALENSVLRAGYHIAHRHLDFWTNVDDPDDKTNRRLRSGGAGSGMPFTPFSASWSIDASPPTPANPEAAPAPDPEGVTGHNSKDRAWAVSNPRTWWRGNMAEKEGTDLRFGRYSIFANRNVTLDAGKFGIAPEGTGPDKEPPTGCGPVTNIPHTWIYNQISSLEKALGFYGLCDYLPANAVYAHYGPWDTGCNLGGMPKWMLTPGGSFNNGDGGQVTPRGKYRNSYQTSYAIINPKGTAIGADLRALHRRHYHLGYGSGVGSHNEFNTLSAFADDYLATKPENWPGLKVSVQRFIKNTRFVNLCRVTWTNPLNGQTAELSFTGFGTTLRGARQQRLPSTDGGWAHWDNAKPLTSPNSTTLDGDL